ncbi:FKBP-type peptidyl-prolyl cis-trans isomerase [Planctomycetes bacterium CA13]
MRDWSVGTAMKIWLPWCLLSFVFMVPGCRSTAKPSPDMTPSPDISSELATSDTPTATWKPLTFVDKPELQAGTGAMDADTAPEFSTTDSGLKYRILRNTDGEKPTDASTVTVNYRGWLNSGKVFDSSYERGEPTSFPLRNVIDGWTEGMQLVGEGGMIELWVPSRLGYGERGSPGSIPAHSNLHFIVELVSVN